MLQSYSPKRICLHEQSPVPWKQQKQDKSRTDTLQRLPRDCVGGRGGPSAVVAAALSMRLLLAPTPAVCGAILSDTIRSAQRSAHTGPAACTAPPPTRYFLQGHQFPRWHCVCQEAHSSLVACCCGKWGLQSTPPKRGRVKSSLQSSRCPWLPAECGRVELGSISKCILAQLWTVPGPTVISPNCSNDTTGRCKPQSCPSAGAEQAQEGLIQGGMFAQRQCWARKKNQGSKTASCYQVLSSQFKSSYCLH